MFMKTRDVLDVGWFGDVYEIVVGGVGLGGGELVRFFGDGLVVFECVVE